MGSASLSLLTNSASTRAPTYIALSGSAAATNINTAYSHLVSGTAAAIRLTCLSSGDLTEFYLFRHSVGGTAANIALRARVYNANGSQGLRPGSTLRATSSTTNYPASNSQWIKFDFATPYAVSLGETVWIVVDATNADPATDFMGVRTDTATGNVYTQIMRGNSTTVGFTADGTNRTDMPAVVKIGSVFYGNPFTGSSTFTSNSEMRGIAITPPTDIRVLAAELGITANISQYSKFRIYAATQATTDTPLVEVDLDTADAADRLSIAVLSTPLTLSGGTKYYAVILPGASTALPTMYAIEDYSTYSSTFDGFVDGWSVCCGVQVSSGSWVENKAMANGFSLVYDQIGTSGSGGIFNPFAGGFIS